MTYEEAIEKLIGMQSADTEDIIGRLGSKYVGGKKYESVYEMSINALEKQIPKKPKRKRCMILCPTCESTSITLFNHAPTEESYIKLAHCIECGQAIDWSDTK